MALNLLEVQWSYAIQAWREGHPEPLARMLRTGEAIPEVVRAFLAEIVEGKAKRKLGHPLGEKDATLHWRITKKFRDFQALLAHANSGHGTPTEQALEATGKLFKTSPQSVRDVVYPRKKGKKIA